MENQESQESSANTEVPFDVTEIIADDINTEGIEGMEGIINTSTQSRDIYGVQPKRNKALKLLALHILKHLPEDILREEPDFSSIKSNEAIQDYGPCIECDTPILTEDPPRSLMLNVCGDMIHRTCAKGTDKRGTLYCSCGKDDDSDPLLPPPDYDNADLFEEICDKYSEVISKVPLSRVGVTLQTPVVLLPCKHRVHFFCIDSKRKLCPKCPSIYELEKEGYYISPTIQETPRKRKRQEGTHKSSRGTKAQTIIRELSVFPDSGPSISAPSESSDMGEVSNQLHKLYYNIDIAETNGDKANRDLVRFYFQFGKALSRQLAILLQSNLPQTAHTILNEEVKEKLP